MLSNAKQTQSQVPVGIRASKRSVSKALQMVDSVQCHFNMHARQWSGHSTGEDDLLKRAGQCSTHWRVDVGQHPTGGWMMGQHLGQHPLWRVDPHWSGCWANIHTEGGCWANITLEGWMLVQQGWMLGQYPGCNELSFLRVCFQSATSSHSLVLFLEKRPQGARKKQSK